MYAFNILVYCLFLITPFYATHSSSSEQHQEKQGSYEEERENIPSNFNMSYNSNDPVEESCLFTEDQAKEELGFHLTPPKDDTEPIEELIEGVQTLNLLEEEKEQKTQKLNILAQKGNIAAYLEEAEKIRNINNEIENQTKKFGIFKEIKDENIDKNEEFFNGITIKSSKKDPVKIKHLLDLSF